VHDSDFSGSHSIAVAVNFGGELVLLWNDGEREGREGRELALRKRLWVNSSGIHEKAAERDALRASDVMSELKLRPPNPYEEKCGRARDPGNFKTRTLQKPKSAAPAKDKRSLRCVEGLATRPGKIDGDVNVLQIILKSR